MKVLNYIGAVSFAFLACAPKSNTESIDFSNSKENVESSQTNMSLKSKGNSVAYFASGCFWCVEAVFESVKGVGEVESGYSGGTKATANYSDVSSGSTSHAEAVKVFYDSTVIDYKTLLKVFFASHDPQTLNRQGPDAGPQYRSVIFYQNETEKKLANEYIKSLLADNTFSIITTQVVPFEAFYIAESYHQDYEVNHPNDGYIQGVSLPRIKKFQNSHPELLK